VSQARARIDELDAALRDGSLSFDEAMAQAGDDDGSMLEAGDLGVVVPGMMDTAVEEALFALATPGEVSEPVRSEFGFHLIRLDAIEEGSQVPLSEIEDELRTELQLQRAENEFFELADELANVAYENPGSLDAVAEAINVEVTESDWITADDGEGIAAEPTVRAAVFSDEVLQEGVNSEPLELSSTRLVVLRLLEHEPAAPRALAEVREEAEQAFREEKAKATIAEAANEVLAAAREGQPLEDLAEGEFKEWVQPVWLSRQGNPDTPPAIVSEAFRLPRAESENVEFATTVLGNGDQAVIQLQAVKDGDPGAAEEETRTGLLAQMKQRYGAEQWQATMEALRARSDIETHPDQL
jgi:peptidyl-prolyl cis-trans isomerase D